MPRVRRKTKHRTLGPGCVWQLATGFDYFDDAWGNDPDDETLREIKLVWQQKRDEMLQRSSAGRRPWAWWQFDSPEPRDEGIPEADQLARLGLLTESETRPMGDCAEGE